MANKFLVWILKTFITITLVMLIFSYSAISIGSILKGLFGDVFSYASLDAQTKTISQLKDGCSIVSQGRQIVSEGQICSNKTLYNEINESCRTYR